MNKKVVFPELEVVEFKFCSSAQCGTKCYFFELFSDLRNSGHCARTALSLTGVDCEGGYIFKKKESWETCTRENTKVGDVVTDKMHHIKYTVEFIARHSGKFVSWREDNNCTDMGFHLSNFEININR